MLKGGQGKKRKKRGVHSLGDELNIAAFVRGNGLPRGIGLRDMGVCTHFRRIGIL